MGFGDEFKEMTDREILVSLYKDTQIMAMRIEAIKCPSPMCLAHSSALTAFDSRLQVIEDMKKFVEKAKQDRYVIWGLLISAIAGWGALVIALAEMLR